MDTNNKEQIISKLEEVFNIATDRYIGTKGQWGNLEKIESLGSTILRHRQHLSAETESTRRFIQRVVEDEVKKQSASMVVRPSIVINS